FMSTGDLRFEEEFFSEVLAQPAECRDLFIAERHAANPAMVVRLRRLLAAHERAEQSSNVATKLMNAHRASTIEQIPEWIGPYRVLERLGEGGMGVVYAAEQTEPIRRRVAVKVIKLGMDTKEVIARFEAERQALAMLDHPGVAKMFDAGSTDAGRPYFVMELVKGLPLTEYCAKHRLALGERLRLFMQMCDAVQHAHQRGIIHRDLKPTNVLVAAPEGRPIPKVIDFGVAKATASRLSERTVFTEQGKLIGTPEYMSPEQAEMSGLDVDTRTDVYSLGVLLYELLTGVLPFDSEKLRSGGYVEIQRIIREVDPPRPSARLAELTRNGAVTGLDRETTDRRLRGELDWIVMRAIEKDRTRRYESAGALYHDVERYLADEPVLAGPPSTTYKLKKFVKRHRLITFAVASVILGGLAGVTGLTMGLVNARTAQALADRRADNAIVAADFLQRILFQVDPEFGGGRLSLQDVIDLASQSIEADLSGHPEVEASVRESIGVAYRRLSLYEEAEPHLRRSLEIRRELLGDSHLQTAKSFVAMAYLIFENEGRIEEALKFLDYASLNYQTHGLANAPVYAWLLLDIGIINLAGDRLSEAEQAFRNSAEMLTVHRDAEHPDVSRPIRGLAMVALQYGDIAKAEEHARRAVMLCEDGGTEYIGARAKLVLARVLIEKSEFDEAAELLDEARAQFARTVDPRHTRMAELDAYLSELHLGRGEFVEAERVAAECESVRREILHPDHWALTEARLLRQRARLGLGHAESVDQELIQISADAERFLVDGHPLRIAIAKARLDCARVLGNESLQSLRADRITQLEKIRANRISHED
ncbi:MAG: protein kinase, partial [Phycisphaerae bacterium]